MTLRQGLVAAFTVTFAHTAYAATIVIADSTFENSDWSSRRDGTNLSGITTTANTRGDQLPIGGNLGSYRQINNFGSHPGFGGGSTFGWHLFEAQTYDPSYSGAIESLDFSEDLLRTSGLEQSGNIALRQDGILFRSKVGYPINGPANIWQPNSMGGLVSTDFEAFFNGNFIPSANPDFSGSGSPIAFGVFRRTPVPARGNFDSLTGLDNWRVSITADVVPEPGSVLLLVTSVLTMAYRR